MRVRERHRKEENTTTGKEEMKDYKSKPSKILNCNYSHLLSAYMLPSAFTFTYFKHLIHMPTLIIYYIHFTDEEIQNQGS